MEITDIIRLMHAVSENGLTSFKFADGNVTLSIKKEKELAIMPALADGGGLAPVGYGCDITAAVNPDGVVQDPLKAMAEDKIVSSPLVGTFYNSSSPEAEPFVKEGDTVKKGQVLGIIEAMKLMNEIESEYDGIVEAVMAGNESLVEYGQPLFRIR